MANALAEAMTSRLRQHSLQVAPAGELVMKLDYTEMEGAESKVVDRKQPGRVLGKGKQTEIDYAAELRTAKGEVLWSNKHRYTSTSGMTREITPEGWRKDKIGMLMTNMGDIELPAYVSYTGARLPMKTLVWQQ
jgi:hypothetical protein